MSSQSESEKQTERFDGKIKNLPESVKQVLQQAWNEGIHWNGALDLSQKDITQDMVGDLIDCLDLFGDRLKELKYVVFLFSICLLPDNITRFTNLIKVAVHAIVFTSMILELMEALN